MKERPIIYNSEMVKAILDGRKTQTRRVIGLEEINRQPDRWEYMRTNADGRVLFWVVADDPEVDKEKRTKLLKCPYGQVGDKLWVRETWRINNYEVRPILRTVGELKLGYKAGGELTVPCSLDSTSKALKYIYWTPSIHMFRWASRITLEITEVRVERVQEISDHDAMAEGVSYKTTNEYVKMRVLSRGQANEDTWPTPQESFMRLWDSINARRGYGWEVNPWCWCISFRRVD